MPFKTWLEKFNRLYQAKEAKFILFFLLLSIGFSIIILILSVLVDPRGVFGTNLIKPVVLTNRTEKLQAMTKWNKPLDLLVFGSSRLFKMDPVLTKKLSGLSTYNASVSYARPEEHLAMLQYLLNETNIKPKIILVGLQVGEFNNDAIEPQTIMNPALRQYLPISRRAVALTAIRTLKDSLSPIYMRDMFLAIFWSVSKYPEDRVTFDQNGYQNFDKNRAKNFSRINKAPLDLFNTDGSLNPEKKNYFSQFVSLANTHQIKIIVFLTPMPSTVIDELTKETTYAAMHQNALTFLSELAAQNKITFYDFSRVQSFNGLEDGFDDSTHPSYQNMNLITKKIFNTFHLR